MYPISRRDFILKTALLGAGAISSSFLGSPDALAQEPDKPLLLLPPFLGKPTQDSLAISIVAGERPITCYMSYRKDGDSGNASWQRTGEFSIKALSPKEIILDSLEHSSTYEYKLFTRLEAGKEFEKIRESIFHTRLIDSRPFSFAMFSDSHINPFEKTRYPVLNSVASSIRTRRPDIALMLGDNIQTFTSHGGPMTEKRFGPVLYAHLRHAIGDLPASVPIFNVIGNWEGENGWHSEQEREWAQEARLSFIPTPTDTTYPEGGSSHGDYYGFTWGNALFLALTVTRYTIPDHAMQSPVGRPDDWALGKNQKQWLYRKLSQSKAKWKFIFVHHTVGGNGGDDVNSRYGRGGGRAAKVGEQAEIHEWMKEFNVQALFYGHDHVFADIPVDGVHYVCVGSAGAPWKFDRGVTGYEKYWTPSGYTWVDVGKNKAKISFVEVGASGRESEVLHSFEII